MTKKNITIADAIDTIANFFYEPQMKRDNDSGEEIEVNACSYIQRRMLNSLCYEAKQSLVNSKASHEQAVDKVRLAMRYHRGDELSEIALQRAVDWAERLEVQQAMLEEFLEVASNGYLAHTGEAFSAPVKQPMTKNKRFTTAALEAASKYCREEPEQPEAGVEVATDRAL